MKAHELARRLLDGPDVEVVIRGYEGGVNSVEEIEAVKIHVDYNLGESYVGRHAICENDVTCYLCDEQPVVVADAIRLTGTNPVGRR